MSQPDLEELLRRIQRRGVTVGPLERARLAHLLQVEGAVCGQRLLPLLLAVLGKEEGERGAVRREFERWAAEAGQALGAQPELEPEAEPGREPAATAETVEEPPQRPRPEEPAGPAAGPAAPPRRRRGRAVAALLLLLLAPLLLLLPKPPPAPPPPPLSPAGTAAAPPAGDTLCPQELPTEAASQVWVWVPHLDHRPWLALAGGLLLLLAVAAALHRLTRAEQRYLARPPGDGPDGAPRRGLPPLHLPGHLLLTPAERREAVWAIDRYVSEEPCREPDLEATVAATAAAGGAPRLVPRHPTFPREVWLWCDRRTARPELQERLVAELRRTLAQANLPLRLATFHGLPDRLRWEEGGEPFTPGNHEGAGGQAVVAVIGDGTGLLRAWRSPGERPGLERLLHELRTWPRLCLVDLSEGHELHPLAGAWRLEVRGPDGLAAWLAGRPGAETPPPDPAQLDLWAAACLLADARPGHDDAEALRRAMGLDLAPLHYAAVAERLEACTQEPRLADRLLNRLARSQPLDPHGLPAGDGYLRRALTYWEQRYDEALATLPPDDRESRARLQLERARLRLWHDPEGATEELFDLAQGRNGALIRRLLGRLAPEEAGEGLRPTWNPAALAPKSRLRLHHLGLAGPRPRLALAVRHHLLLALLCGAAVTGAVWGGWRLTQWGAGGDPVFRDPRFLATLLDTGGDLGGPRLITPVARLGHLATPYAWAYEPQANPRRLGAEAGLFIGGTQNFPIRACGDGWPHRSLAVIEAPLEESAARQLAIRLLDRGSADRVLVAPDWRRRLGELTQGVSLPDDQLLLFLPQGSTAGAVTVANWAEIHGPYTELAAAVDFGGARPAAAAFPGAAVRVGAGHPLVNGGPERYTDPKSRVTWVHVCGGSFLMGSGEEEDRHVEEYARQWARLVGSKPENEIAGVRRWLATERTRHPVLLDDYWITRTELTEGQTGGTGDLPRSGIDWATARAACAALAAPPGSAGWSGDLPSEAQWEYAARAGSAGRWSFGDDEGRLGDFAWYRENSGGKAHPVGEKQPNALCLADLHGNLWEWGRDCYRTDAYGGFGPLAIDPAVESAGCDRRVVRGGSSWVPPVLLRSAGRDFDWPGGRRVHLGLRCVRSRVRQP